MGVDVMVGVASVGVTVGVGETDGVIICGSSVHVGALVREGEGWIVMVGVQVESRGMMVLVGVSV